MIYTTIFKNKWLYDLILTLLFTPILASATISEFSPEIDTWIRENAPTEQFNYLDFMVLGRTDWGEGTKADRIVLSFDLSLIPSNAVIQSAILYLDFYSYSIPWENSPLPNTSAVCYPITKIFGENSSWTLTWLYYDWCGEDYCLWDNPGGDYNPFFGSARTMPVEFGIVDWDIKEMTKDEILNGDKQLNVLLKLVEEIGGNTWWDFRTTSATEGQIPKLIIEWTEEEPPPPMPPIVDFTVSEFLGLLLIGLPVFLFCTIIIFRGIFWVVENFFEEENDEEEEGDFDFLKERKRRFKK